MRHYLFVGVGSAVGGLARFGTVTAAVAVFGPGFPIATLFVNVLGSLLIGLIAGLSRAESRLLITPERRSLLAVGFCGGFTTFSFFSWHILALAEAGQAPLALLYLASTTLFSLLAVGIGYVLAGLPLGRVP